MKPVALVLAVAVALSASPAVAEESTPKQRGFLTGLGLGLLAVGGAGIGVGIGGTIGAVESNAAVAAVGARTEENSLLLAAIGDNHTIGSVFAVGGFVLAAAAIISGIICIARDAPAPPVVVTFMPTAQGGMFALSANF